MGGVLGNGEIDHARALPSLALQLLDQAARQRTAHVQDTAIGIEQ